MKRKILVIENDKNIRKFETCVLVQKRYEILAMDAELEVFEHLASFLPDVILLDLIKPNDLGTQICDSLKKDECTKHIPVLTLYSDFKIVDLLSNCIDRVVSNPFNGSKLIETIEKQIEALKRSLFELIFITRQNFLNG
jgi:CheY-like chemotaxis protein